MIATSHVIIGGAVGIAVGTVTQNPAAALAAGIVSHLLCDSLPHLDLPPNAKIIGDEVVWDRSMYTFAITDSLLAFFITLSLWYFKDHLDISSMLAWGAGGGYLPDLLDNFPLWREWMHATPGFKQFHTLHIAIHHNWMRRFPMKHYWPLGIVTQLVTVLPCLYYLIK